MTFEPKTLQLASCRVPAGDSAPESDTGERSEMILKWALVNVVDQERCPGSRPTSTGISSASGVRVCLRGSLEH